MHAGRLIPVLLFAVCLPAFGLLIAYLIHSDINADLLAQGKPSAEVLCSRTEATAKVCGHYVMVRYLGFASTVAAFSGLIIPLMFWIAGLLAGHDRQKLADIFPPLVPVALVLMSVSILLQGAVLVYGMVVGGHYLLDRTSFALMKIVGIFGLGALAAAWLVISTLFKSGKRLDMVVAGLPLTPASAPRLFGFVQGLAAKLGAQPPVNIVVGLEPTFYVTSADVSLIGGRQPLTGETLYVSAPLARVLSPAELAAVIGHELGHFRGEDTAYSLKFAPVYAGLCRAMDALDERQAQEDQGFLGKLAGVPASRMLGFMLDVFAHAESAVGREREHLADEAGAEASSALSIATSLVKISLYAGAWGRVQHDNVHRLNQGKVTGNLSRIFESTARYDIEQESLDSILAYVSDKAIAHPTDSHPPVSERMAWLGVDPAWITKDLLMVPEESAIELIENAQATEEQLTALEHKLMVAMGYVEPPESQEGQDDYLLKTTYQLAAAMAAADGHIDQSEVQAAEAIGAELFSHFDPVDFREACNAHEELPAINRLAGFLKETLDEDQRSTIFAYLNAIAEADGDIDPREQDLLRQVAASLGLADHSPPQHLVRSL